jgi:polyphosphate kinase
MNVEPSVEDQQRLAKIKNKTYDVIDQSEYISRDLSWLRFNERVLDQAKDGKRHVFDRLKFLAITASNLDEFFTIRVGSLYNYLDYGKERVDYSGLREVPFRKTLLARVHQFYQERNDLFREEILPQFESNGLFLADMNDLTDEEQAQAIRYFDRTIYPMLTPMVFDQTHTFPSLLPRTLIFGVVTKNAQLSPQEKEAKKISFVQIPANLPRFFVLEREDVVVFLPIEEIVRHEIQKLYRNVDIQSVNLFRLIRNGDFTIEESDDIEDDLVDEIRQKVKSRRLGRVVKMAVEPNTSEWLLDALMKRWDIDQANIFKADTLLDFTGFWQIIKHPEFREKLPKSHTPVRPLGIKEDKIEDIFETMKAQDILLHHPFNNFEPVLQLLEQAAQDPSVLSIKLTIYRLAKNSRVTNALLKAAENGKHVSVLFEVKARFDEENNIREAERLQKAGCFVIYGIGRFKTHTKLLLVVRNESEGVVQYAHLSSGNYNEETAKLYTDIGLLTTNEAYTRDISEFFNVITGHSLPIFYENLLTAPRDLRKGLISLIQQETANAKAGLPSGICIKINSMEDRFVIDELYKASEAGVPIRLIVRGICCLRPKRIGLSQNIIVRSIVGDYLEHTRIFYFHQNGQPIVYGGSADIMNRSFDRRIESLFALVAPHVKQQAIHILHYNLLDNVNAYELQEDGTYLKISPAEGQEAFNIHQRFFDVTEAMTKQVNLF